MRRFLEYLKYDIKRVGFPLAYHGENKSAPFFEGWYFKVISQDGTGRMSIIPGIYTAPDPSQSHAFIQVIDGVDGTSQYFTYTITDFKYVPKKMEITVGNSYFSMRKIVLDIRDEKSSIEGTLQFDNLSPWPVTVLSPGVMGWFAWVPAMECYHGIVSMNHDIQGTLMIDGKPKDFSNGRGYIEKDWGKAMPSAWVWMQCNHFLGKVGTSLSVSIAKIPWLFTEFDGFLCGFQLDGKLYRFATYTGAHIKDLNLTNEEVSFTIYDRKRKLMIRADRAKGNLLQAPTTHQMDRRIMETLSAEVDVTLLEKRDHTWVESFSGKGKFAGLEIVGDLESR